MKKIILPLLALVLLCTSGCASKSPQANSSTPTPTKSVSSTPQPKINFDGEVFELKYSAKNKDSSQNINEYYLPQEKYSNWTKLVGVFYYPNEVDHLAYAKKFKSTLPADRTQAMLINKTGGILLAFTLIEADKSGGGEIEDNIFKIEKSPKGGTVAFQYANRRFVKSAKEAEGAGKYIVSNQERWIKAVLDTPIPQLVETKVDLGN